MLKAFRFVSIGGEVDGAADVSVKGHGGLRTESATNTGRGLNDTVLWFLLVRDG